MRRVRDPELAVDAAMQRWRRMGFHCIPEQEAFNTTSRQPPGGSAEEDWATKLSRTRIDEMQSQPQQTPPYVEPVPGPADRCPESSFVEHEEVVEYPTFTSLA
eukprot:3936235-Rhodomonas_salina.5